MQMFSTRRINEMQDGFYLRVKQIRKQVEKVAQQRETRIEHIVSDLSRNAASQSPEDYKELQRMLGLTLPEVVRLAGWVEAQEMFPTAAANAKAAAGAAAGGKKRASASKPSAPETRTLQPMPPSRPQGKLHRITASLNAH